MGVSLQARLRRTRREWARRGQWQEPDTLHALAFAATELGEAMDECLRLEAGFVRNNKRAGDTDRLAVEIFDMIMMGIIALDSIGANLEQVAAEKLAAMEAKRVIPG